MNEKEDEEKERKKIIILEAVIKIKKISDACKLTPEERLAVLEKLTEDI